MTFTGCLQLPLQPHPIRTCYSTGTPPPNNRLLTKKLKAVVTELNLTPQLHPQPTLTASKPSTKLTMGVGQQSPNLAPSQAPDSRCLQIELRHILMASVPTRRSKTTCSGSASPSIRVTCQQARRPAANSKAIISAV